MSFKKINNITGWAVCIFACIVYLMTMEATGSFWDCGEFASSCFKLQIPHPPGAPLFVLMGRLFTIPFAEGHNGALGVNTMSALASGFTILFLFWSITHFARKIVLKNGGTLSNNNIFAIMAAGVVGALGYAFSDSFWYSAVEAEVYATSAFFTAIVFWAILKWEQEATVEIENGVVGRFTRADRWLILIAYLIGLAVGVHLLNLLTVPAIVMIYYFRRNNATPWGTFWAFVIGCVLTGVLQIAVLQWTIKIAGQFDIWFRHDLGLPFFTGFAFFFVLLAAVVAYLIRLANRKNYNYLRLGMWALSFMLLGFSTYFTTMIRSNANPAIDMYKVDNPVSLVGYLSREQYGDWPILYGQDFTAEPTEQKSEDIYVKGADDYVKKGKKYVTEFNPDDKHLFPRMWDNSNEQSHVDYYLGFTGDHVTKDPKTGKMEGKPTMGDNINFFVSYQVNWMFWRYFMWNYAGKQNDIEGIDLGNVRDGNWKSGVGFVDNLRLGDQSKMPDNLKYNKSNNTLFFLPFILGILGLIYHIKKDKNDALVAGLLFFFMGFAIIVYLNQAGNQPRERDYAFAGSTYAFAIWIGIGVLYLRELLSKKMSLAIAGYVSAGACFLAVPLLMGCQEWDDHDRSKKTLARDLAIDYLESCPQNAILITFGDNDTYPLWYAQEVEGIRRDIRVINQSLLGTDWYINELRHKINKSDPIDLVWGPDKIIGNKRDGIYFDPNLPGVKVDQTQPMDLYSLLNDYAGSDDPSRTVMSENEGGDTIYVYPTKKVKVPVDMDLVRQNGMVNNGDNVVTEVDFDLGKNVIGKNDAAILNIIAANKWKRPVCFTSYYNELGFGEYLRSKGMVYELVPVKNAGTDRNWVLDKMLNKFVFGNCDKHGVYYDEENRRHLNTLRQQYGAIAMDFSENGRKEDAKKLLEFCDKMTSGIQEVVNHGESKETIYNFPYGMPSRHQMHDQISLQFLAASYLAGDSALAEKVTASLRKDLEQQITYYNSLSEDKQAGLSYEAQGAQELYGKLTQMKEQFKRQEIIDSAKTITALDTSPINKIKKK